MTPASILECTIRAATPEDLPEIERLVDGSGHAPALELMSEGHHLLVLDAPDGGLAACAVLDIEGHRGHLTMLAIASRYQGRGIEDRMIAVVEAISPAFGADTLDIVQPHAA